MQEICLERRIHLICFIDFLRSGICHHFAWHLHITFPSYASFSGIGYRNQSTCILFRYLKVSGLINSYEDILANCRNSMEF